MLFIVTQTQTSTSMQSLSITLIFLLTIIIIAHASNENTNESKKDIKSIEPKSKKEIKTKNEITSTHEKQKLRSDSPKNIKPHSLTNESKENQKTLRSKQEARSKSERKKVITDTKTESKTESKNINDKSKTFNKDRHRPSTIIQTSSPTTLSTSAQTTNTSETKNTVQTITDSQTYTETKTDQFTKTMVSTEFICRECALTKTSTIWEASVVTDRALYGKIHTRTKYRKSYDYTLHETIAIADYYMVSCIPAQNSVLEYIYDNEVRTTTLSGIYDNAIIPITSYEGADTVTETQYIDSQKNDVYPITVTQETWFTDTEGQWKSSPMTVILMTGKQSENTCYCPPKLSGYVGVHSNGYYNNERLIQYSNKKFESEEERYHEISN